MKIYNRQAIQEFIPHRLRMLLLDKVYSVPESLIGELLITGDLCEGHTVFGEGEIFRGCELYDIAGQLLGVWVALQNLNLEINKGIYVVRRYGEAVFRERIAPGDILKMELLTANARVDRVRNLGWRIIGKHFVVKVEGKVRSRISFVELFVA